MAILRRYGNKEKTENNTKNRTSNTTDDAKKCNESKILNIDDEKR